jgi:molecular chaperone GrpE
MNERDPLATHIADDVIQQALQSVERHSGHVTETDPAAGAAPANEVSSHEEPARLRDELLQARLALRQREAELETSQALGRETLEKLRDQHERVLRAAADQENCKKRAARERDEVVKFGQERLLRDLLPVVDNLDRALEHAHTPTDFEGLRTGIQMTRKLFEDTLGRFGITTFSALGLPFDPNLHEAMQAVESDAPPNTVVHEMVRGYVSRDAGLRMVTRHRRGGHADAKRLG